MCVCWDEGLTGEQTEQRNSCYGDNELEESRRRKSKQAEADTGGCGGIQVWHEGKTRGKKTDNKMEN